MDYLTTLGGNKVVRTRICSLTLGPWRGRGTEEYEAKRTIAPRRQGKLISTQ